MFTLNIKAKLILFSLFAISGMLWVGWTGYTGLTHEEIALQDMTIKMTALRNHLESDMMHDALRGDVIASLYAATTGDTETQNNVLRDYKDHADFFQTKINDNFELELPAQISTALANFKPILDEYIFATEHVIGLSQTDVQAAQAAMPEFLDHFEAVQDSMFELATLIENNAETARVLAETMSTRSVSTITTIIIAISAAFAIATGFLLIGILKPIRHLRGAINRLRKNTGELSRIHGFTGEFAQVQDAFNGLLDEMEAEQAEEHRQARAAYRVQEALNSTTTSVMLTNSQQQIIYLNHAAQAMISRAEANIRKRIPDFSASDIIGCPLRVLIPDEQVAKAIRESQETREDELKVGLKTYRITSTPVYSNERELLGMVSEWHDLSEQREAERQIQKLLSEAIDGRLEARLDATHFKGFMHTLATSMNSLMDAITTPVNVAAEQLHQIAKGTIPEPGKVQFKGAFNDICTNLNTCCTVLRAMINDTTTLVDAASAGQLHVRADINNHWGDFRSIVEGMNRTLDAVAAPVTEVKEVVSGFANGDLTRRMQGQYSGDFAVLGNAVNTSIDNLADLVSRINQSATNISHAAGEISNGNQDLSTRTQDQASTLEETRSSLQNLTETSEENTASAKQANDLAKTAQEKAERGGRIVQDAVVAMDAINKASKQIADIIAVIDGITFQTNLLALNASVEAARAGEQGRGFAVVASEVRNLAQRSTQAASEIKQLINDAVSKMDHGSELVNASGETLKEIVTAVNMVGTIISEISVSSENQLRDFSGVTDSIFALDDVTQQNAALVEEAAAASESMAEQAHSMRELMEFFKTSEHRKSSPGIKKLQLSSAPRTKASPKPASALSAPRRPALKVVAAAGAGAESWSEF